MRSQGVWWALRLGGGGGTAEASCAETCWEIVECLLRRAWGWERVGRRCSRPTESLSQERALVRWVMWTAVRDTQRSPGHRGRVRRQTGTR